MVAMVTPLLKTAISLVLMMTTVMAADRPHIVIIVVDDLGWSDVSWRDPEMKTPTLDTLVSKGVNLTSAYVQPLCSPSRAALLSGKYPFRMGMQDTVLSAGNNASLPLSLELLPERLQNLGYSTYLVGKWHLGFCSWDMTPTYRGFDSFYGMYLGKGGHYDHEVKNGYDMHDNLTPDRNATNVYSTHLFTDKAIEILEQHTPDTDPIFLMLSYQAVHDPLEVPEEYKQNCSHVTNETRMIHCAMTYAVDEGIANVTKVLTDKGYGDNLLLFFTTDNGGPPNIGSSNWPFRGGKSSLWEGGTRAVSFLHSKTLLPDAPYTWDGLIHAVDWFPTLLGVADNTSTVADIDGINMWQQIQNNIESLRTKMVYNVNEVKNNAALRWGRFKLTFGDPGNPDGFNYPTNNETIPSIPAPPAGKYQLFDLVDDPQELYDVRNNNRKMFRDMKAWLEVLQNETVPAEDGVYFNASEPKYFNNTWYPGWC